MGQMRVCFFVVCLGLSGAWAGEEATVAVRNEWVKEVDIAVYPSQCFPPTLLTQQKFQLSLDSAGLALVNKEVKSGTCSKLRPQDSPNSGGSWRLVPKQQRFKTANPGDVLYIKAGYQERFCYVKEGTKAVVLKGKLLAGLRLSGNPFSCFYERE